MSDELNTTDTRSEAEVRASALAADLDETRARLEAATTRAQAAEAQLLAAADRAAAAETAAGQAQGRLAELEASATVLVLARDTIVGQVPRSVRTRVATLVPEAGFDGAWILEAIARGALRIR